MAEGVREQQLAVGKEVCCGVGLDGGALFNLAPTPWDMDFVLADFHIGKFGGVSSKIGSEVLQGFQAARP